MGLQKLLRIAARVSVVKKEALPESWRLITDEQIEEVMKRMPPGTEKYGSYATGQASQGSDLDLKLPGDIGEKELSKLMLKTMRELDLNIGSLNISMPCSQHPNCSIVAHTDEGHLYEPLIEHLEGGMVDSEKLPEEKKQARKETKEHRDNFIKNEETDAYFRMTDDDKKTLDKLLSGKDIDDVIHDLHLDDLIEKAGVSIDDGAKLREILNGRDIVEAMGENHRKLTRGDMSLRDVLEGILKDAV